MEPLRPFSAILGPKRRERENSSIGTGGCIAASTLLLLLLPPFRCRNSAAPCTVAPPGKSAWHRPHRLAEGRVWRSDWQPRPREAQGQLAADGLWPTRDCLWRPGLWPMMIEARGRRCDMLHLRPGARDGGWDHCRAGGCMAAAGPRCCSTCAGGNASSSLFLLRAHAAFLPWRDITACCLFTVLSCLPGPLPLSCLVLSCLPCLVLSCLASLVLPPLSCLVLPPCQE